MRALTHSPPPEDWAHTFFFENTFTGSIAESQGLQGLLQEDEGTKDPLSSPATERCARYSVTTAPPK